MPKRFMRTKKWRGHIDKIDKSKIPEWKKIFLRDMTFWKERIETAKSEAEKKKAAGQLAYLERDYKKLKEVAKKAEKQGS